MAQQLTTRMGTPSSRAMANLQRTALPRRSPSGHGPGHRQLRLGVVLHGDHRCRQQCRDRALRRRHQRRRARGPRHQSHAPPRPRSPSSPTRRATSTPRCCPATSREALRASRRQRHRRHHPQYVDKSEKVKVGSIVITSGRQGSVFERGSPSARSSVAQQDVELYQNISVTPRRLPQLDLVQVLVR